MKKTCKPIPTHIRNMMFRLLILLMWSTTIYGCASTTTSIPQPTRGVEQSQQIAPSAIALTPSVAEINTAPLPIPSANSNKLPEPQTLSFNHNGDYAIAIVDDGIIQFLISLSDLEDGLYSISLEDSAGSGASFEPGNSYLYTGVIKDELYFAPYFGKITLWSAHPLRIIQSTDIKIIVRNVDEDTMIVRSSEPINASHSSSVHRTYNESPPLNINTSR